MEEIWTSAEILEKALHYTVHTVHTLHTYTVHTLHCTYSVQGLGILFVSKEQGDPSKYLNNRRKL